MPVARTKATVRAEPADPASIERGVRQLLAQKVSGTMMGLWLMVPEHLRLGTWDLLLGWTEQLPQTAAPRLALQRVHEAALCVTGVRQGRCLSQKGFEVANGLPFVAGDKAMHLLLDGHTVAQAQELQKHLGLIRRARGHFAGQILAIDPHRRRSYTRRQTPRRKCGPQARSFKTAQTFFCLDADTHQPVCFTTASSAQTVSQATPGLLELARQILDPEPGATLVVADTEHYTAGLIDHVHSHTPFDLLVPMADSRHVRKRAAAVPPEEFTRHWAGFATARGPYQPRNGTTGPHWEFIQRSGETPGTYHYKSFLATTARDEADALTRDFPKRWHIEEFFNTSQALAWQRAGTLNQHIRCGQMSLALIAQAALHQMRRRLGDPFQTWQAGHLARNLLQGIDGDIRVRGDTILVTLYNAPHTETLREHYEHLPARLAREGVDPHIPWLYGLKLDFRFR